MPEKLSRDDLGRVVREAWIKWAKTTLNPNPSWLVPYDEMPESDREADRQIGCAVRNYVLENQTIENLLS